MSELQTTYSKSAQEDKRKKMAEISRRLGELREQALASPHETFTAITSIGVYTVTKLTPELLDKHGVPHDNPYLLGAIITSGSFGSHKVGDEHHTFFQTYKPRQPSPATQVRVLEA